MMLKDLSYRQDIMISIKITDIKKFTNSLFIDNTFDDFRLIEGSVSTFATYDITGRVNKNFYDDKSNLPDYNSWSMLKPCFFYLIKGKRLPLSFKIVLSCPDNIRQDLSSDSTCTFLVNVRFAGNLLSVTTGYSRSTFSLDKEPEKSWDEFVLSFLNSHGFDYERDI